MRQKERGEGIKARTVLGLLVEAVQKFWAYDEMIAFFREAAGL
jgi:hypothetical protein